MKSSERLPGRRSRASVQELETVKFELEAAGGTWKIIGPIIPPHVSLAAHERALAER